MEAAFTSVHVVVPNHQEPGDRRQREITPLLRAWVAVGADSVSPPRRLTLTTVPCGCLAFHCSADSRSIAAGYVASSQCPRREMIFRT